MACSSDPAAPRWADRIQLLREAARACETAAAAMYAAADTMRPAAFDEAVTAAETERAADAALAAAGRAPTRPDGIPLRRIV